MMLRRPFVLVAWLGGLGLAAAVLVASTGPLLDELGQARMAPDAAVAATAAAAAWLVLGWLGVGLALSVAEVLVAAVTRTGGALVGRLASTVAPSSVRQAVHRSLRVGLVAGAVGTTLVLPAVALAAPAAPTLAARPTDHPLPLRWPVLDRPAVPVDIAPGPRPSSSHPRPAGSRPARYLVRPGDSLWSIAADHLPVGASQTDVAGAWPRWWRANRAVVGPDPGLIRPGQLLRVPGVPS